MKRCHRLLPPSCTSSVGDPETPASRRHASPRSDRWVGDQVWFAKLNDSFFCEISNSDEVLKNIFPSKLTIKKIWRSGVVRTIQCDSSKILSCDETPGKYVDQQWLRIRISDCGGPKQKKGNVNPVRSLDLKIWQTLKPAFCVKTEFPPESARMGWPRSYLRGGRLGLGYPNN